MDERLAALIEFEECARKQAVASFGLLVEGSTFDGVAAADELEDKLEAITPDRLGGLILPLRQAARNAKAIYKARRTAPPKVQAFIRVHSMTWQLVYQRLETIAGQPRHRAGPRYP